MSKLRTSVKPASTPELHEECQANKHLVQLCSTNYLFANNFRSSFGWHVKICQLQAVVYPQHTNLKAERVSAQQISGCKPSVAETHAAGWPHEVSGPGRTRQNVVRSGAPKGFLPRLDCKGAPTSEFARPIPHQRWRTPARIVLICQNVLKLSFVHLPQAIGW